MIPFRVIMNLKLDNEPNFSRDSDTSEKFAIPDIDVLTLETDGIPDFQQLN